MNRRTYQPRHARRRGLTYREHIAAAIGTLAGTIFMTIVYLAIEITS